MLRKKHLGPFLNLQGVAEAELEKNLERTFKILFFSGSEMVSRRSAGTQNSPSRQVNGVFPRFQDTRPRLSTAGVCARGETPARHICL